MPNEIILPVAPNRLAKLMVLFPTTPQGHMQYIYTNPRRLKL